ncbi:MAG: hypothetical protein KTR15_07295 [Phycisphaeraceae bacterium]|nr:hypothetical protein [Phycisphaeraceae bacterium]
MQTHHADIVVYGDAHRVRVDPDGAAFMILSENAAAAACLAIDEGVAVQDVVHDKLKPVLVERGQVLSQ